VDENDLGAVEEISPCMLCEGTKRMINLSRGTRFPVRGSKQAPPEEWSEALLSSWRPIWQRQLNWKRISVCVSRSEKGLASWTARAR
jgi:hypothetical protein